MKGTAPDSIAVDARHPLTPLQQGMLFHWLSDRHSGIDIEQLVIESPEELDAAQLEAAWRQVTLRHPVLRTRFSWEGGLEQVIEAQASPKFAVLDHRALDEAAESRAFETWLHADRMSGFCLETAPPQRVALFRLAAGRCRIVWTFHHILLDGRSFPLLLDEVFAQCEGRAPESPAEAGFFDHVAALQRIDFHASEAWWKEQLRGFSAPTPLPVVRVGECEDAPRQADREIFLPSSLAEGLRSLAGRCRVTLNTLFQAAWALVLSRCTGETDVVFGAVRACRKSTVPGLDDAAGLFINTLPVRAMVDPDKPLQAFLEDLRASWVAMRPHEHTPLPQIHAWSSVDGDKPLLQTAVNFDGFDLGEALALQHPAWQRRRIRLYEKPGFPLVLAVHGGQRISLRLEYDNRQFAADAMERMLGHLEMLCASMVSRPEARLRDLEMLTDAERHQLVREWNPPAAGPPTEGTLPELFARQVLRTPHAVALAGEGVSLTYAELDRRSDAVAVHLRQHGVKRETVVGLCLERRPELVIALLGILKAGGAYLPIDLAYPQDRLAFMMEDAGAPVFLTERNLAGRLPASTAAIICMEDIPALAEGVALEAVPQTPDQLCYVLYTSGSTGKPKGCCITHHNVARLFSATDPWFRFDGSDVWTLFHSTAFDFSVWEIWGALLYGGRLVVVPYHASRSPEEFLHLLAAEKVTVLNQTPSAFRQLMAAEEALPEQSGLALRLVIFGGEALEMQSLQPWFQRHGDQHPQLVNMYGITETTVHVTWRPLSSRDLRGGSVIGIPIPDLQVYILDAALRPVPMGVPGELFVGGAGLARGYWQRPELTAGRFIPDHLSGNPSGRLYRTGDLARFLPGRDIEYLGRIDQQVKIRGFRIELGEIESVLCSHPLVREAAVIPREDTPGEKRLCAYVVSAQSVPPTEALRSHLREKLPDYMVPAAFVFLDRFPITNNGKLDRAALPAPQMERESLGNAYLAPGNAIEEALAAVWAAVLKVNRVGVNDNFFELGGDSILSIHLIAQARKAGLQVTPRQLFENPTVAALAAVAGAQASTAPQPVAVAVDPADIPLLPVQHWFFEQELRDSSHWNQAFLFQVSERLDPAALRAAVAALLEHHEAFRLRFRRDAGGRWIQFLAASPVDDVLEVHRHPGLANGALGSRMREIVDGAHRGFDYQMGPVLKVVYLDLGEDRPGRLLLAAHHLVVDGVSWSILRHDLETACRQAALQQAVQLPAVPAPYLAAAIRPAQWLELPAAREELAWWSALQERWDGAPVLPPDVAEAGANTEGSVAVAEISLSEKETSELLQAVPRICKMRITEVLLAAWALAFVRVTGRRNLCLHVERHGREDVFGSLDLSHTIGWFTAIHPLLLDLPSSDLADALGAAKESLRQVPQHGAGYGVWKYCGYQFSGAMTADVLFNYLGRLDQITDGSELFLPAPESTQPWHGPASGRRYAVEIDSWVLHGCFCAAWRFSKNLHREETVQRLAEAFAQALREIILFARSEGGPVLTPAEFPAARLDQASLTRLGRLPGGVEDVFALSPGQVLFHTAAATKANAGFDQWQFRIASDLDLAAYQKSWQRVFRQHPLLRASFHAVGLPHPVQVIHESDDAHWEVVDWSALTLQEAEARWVEWTTTDAARGNDLTKGPLPRFMAAKLPAGGWRFCWSVPDLMLDGWSWPVVFGAAGKHYAAIRDGAPPERMQIRSFRQQVEWLAERNWTEEEHFWRAELRGVTGPTPLPMQSPASARARRMARSQVRLDAGTAAAFSAFCRQRRFTPAALVQAAWVLLLARASAAPEVVIGAAFSGRAAEIPGVEEIVGPFSTNLPVRLGVDADVSGGVFLQQVQEKLLTLTEHQYASVEQLHDWSEIPWSLRLFESLVVFQNYRTDAAARPSGSDIEISEFSGPVHTNYPLTLVVTPDADSWECVLLHQETCCQPDWAAMLLADAVGLMQRLVSQPDISLKELLAACKTPEDSASRLASPRRPSGTRTAPRTPLQQQIAAVWTQAFGHAEFGVDDNFFDLGAQSLLLLRVHKKLREVTGREISIVQIFQHPTISSLAAFLQPPGGPSGHGQSLGEQARERAAAARAALTRGRSGRRP